MTAAGLSDDPGQGETILNGLPRHQALRVNRTFDVHREYVPSSYGLAPARAGFAQSDRESLRKADVRAEATRFERAQYDARWTR